MPAYINSSESIRRLETKAFIFVNLSQRLVEMTMWVKNVKSVNEPPLITTMEKQMNSLPKTKEKLLSLNCKIIAQFIGN